MDVVAIIVESLVLIFPAYCANAAPVLAGGGLSLDFGRNFVDGRRIFGKNKTFRGFFFGLTIGILVGLIDFFLFGFPWQFIVLSPLGALLGDLTGAFVKRRLDIPPGGLLPIVDQIDFVIGAIIFTLPLMIISIEVAVAMLIITPPIHLLTNFAAYKLKLKSNPW
ncbi:MAG: CDP-2,3-bis-(O-geranylgeranyl)-sn-glycerol synthase [Chloroflexota bacterium]|jgi:CDP-2,3-bis-(O-geranylgeranyl)-sn-glycerol synthase|nr:CDP-2,3-bis-(O-geranylgeranyl)-sn-glycerol synthase [Candidatus Sulfotelmatobacter sp.]